MERKLFAGLNILYDTNAENPKSIKIMVYMHDSIESSALLYAVDITMKRYPYFCVELARKDGQYVLLNNCRPVKIINSDRAIELNSETSNYHLLAFKWYDNCIVMEVSHALTDGTGAYEIIRTLLYYYCSKRYDVVLEKEGIRLFGDAISVDEWNDPLCYLPEMPLPKRPETPDALDLIKKAGLENDNLTTVYSVSVSESEFMKFNSEHAGSPGTMVALLLCRAVAKLYPDAEEPIRIYYAINQRKVLKTPLAHQSLVGGAILEYFKELRPCTISEQVSAFRKMVFEQAQEKAVFAELSEQINTIKMIMSAKTDQERMSIAGLTDEIASKILTAEVSYVGKGNFGEAEKYIKDFHMWTPPVGKDMILIEISAVNGRFIFDINQTFSCPIYVNAFLNELKEIGIIYDMQGMNTPKLSGVKLPWTDEQLPVCRDIR